MRIKDIIAETADKYGVTVEDILSRAHGRNPKYVIPRREALLLAIKHHPNLSAASIARHFNRHHTFVLYHTGRVMKSPEWMPKVEKPGYSRWDVTSMPETRTSPSGQ